MSLVQVVQRTGFSLSPSSSSAGPLCCSLNSGLSISYFPLCLADKATFGTLVLLVSPQGRGYNSEKSCLLPGCQLYANVTAWQVFENVTSRKITVLKGVCHIYNHISTSKKVLQNPTLIYISDEMPTGTYNMSTSQ